MNLSPKKERIRALQFLSRAHFSSWDQIQSLFGPVLSMILWDSREAMQSWFADQRQSMLVMKQIYYGTFAIMLVRGWILETQAVLLAVRSFFSHGQIDHCKPRY